MTGYHKLADLIDHYPELAIYRKFGVSATTRLLHMQAELSHLEREIQIISTTDQANSANADFASSWIKLNKASPETGADLQIRKVREFDDKLDKYYSALLQTAQVHSLCRPNESSLEFLRFWLGSPQGGKSFLKGIEGRLWNKEHTDDLVTLWSGAKDDPFAQYLNDKIVPRYHERIGHLGSPSVNRDLGHFWEYKNELFTILADVICAILSSLIPILSILWLCYVEGMAKRLAVITVTSFLFSFIMAGVVRGRRVDVFAATTAFAAVQVAFVTGVNIVLNH